jgi:threonylcarbamoyladenosine tRNA methylthiotransferase MtaB
MVIKNKKISITTLGCRVNLFESNQIIEQIREQDGIYTSESNDADIVIINTCSVTNKADSKSLYFINKACKNKKTKLVVVCGCFSQANAKVLTNKKIGIILGTKYKSKVIELIKQ